MSTDSSLSFFTKLKNKARYQMEKWVNDPEANAFVSRMSQVDAKEAEATNATEKEKEPIKEAMEDAPVEETSNSPVVRVLQKMLYYAKWFFSIAFFPIIALFLSSLVANEMIIYPAPIRLIFFIFTLVLCFLSRILLVIIGMFYLGKWAFHYYVNNMTDGPKRLIAPSLFAFLPLTTRTSSNPFFNALLKPFQYGEQWSVKDGEELKTRMEMYQTSLTDAFPYIETLQTTEPFQSQLKKITTSFEELHRAFQPVLQGKEQEEQKKPLPPVIQQEQKQEQEEKQEEKQTSPLPPVIQQERTST